MAPGFAALLLGMTSVNERPRDSTRGVLARRRRCAWQNLRVAGIEQCVQETPSAGFDRAAGLRVAVGDTPLTLIARPQGAHVGAGDLGVELPRQAECRLDGQRTRR